MIYMNNWYFFLNTLELNFFFQIFKFCPKIVAQGLPDASPACHTPTTTTTIRVPRYLSVTKRLSSMTTTFSPISTSSTTWTATVMETTALSQVLAATRPTVAQMSLTMVDLNQLRSLSIWIWTMQTKTLAGSLYEFLN